MPGLDEHQILDRLNECFREAIEHCRNTGNGPMRGMEYIRFKNAMIALEGCCRQVGVCRDDTAWATFVNTLWPATARAGDWLRKYPITSTSNEAKPLFDKLAEILEGWMARMKKLRDSATGQTGTRLPLWMAPIRAQYGRSAGGIILPPGYNP